MNKQTETNVVSWAIIILFLLLLLLLLLLLFNLSHMIGLILDVILFFWHQKCT